MKRETKPSRRLRMHIVLLASEGLSPTRIARVLYCSRTTVYAVVRRFLAEGEAAFADRKKRGPRPKLTEEDRGQLSEEVGRRGAPLGTRLGSHPLELSSVDVAALPGAGG